MRKRTWRSKLEPFRAKVDELLSNDVWNAAVIYRVLKEQGYQGKTTILRNYIHPTRPLRQKRMAVRFGTRPGKQLQNDWGEIFNDHVLATAILDHLLHHCTTVSIKGRAIGSKKNVKPGC
jgi:transposase